MGLYVKLEATPGTTIGSAAQESLEFVLKHGMNVDIEFNGRKMMITPNMTTDGIVDWYNRQINATQNTYVHYDYDKFPKKS